MSGLSALRASGRFIVKMTTLPSRSTVQCFVVIGRVSGTVAPGRGRWVSEPDGSVPPRRSPSALGYRTPSVRTRSLLPFSRPMPVLDPPGEAVTQTDTHAVDLSDPATLAAG